MGGLSGEPGMTTRYAPPQSSVIDGEPVTAVRRQADHEPIARVLPMLSVPHLDREFDYLVSADQSDDAQPGVRVQVRFHGRLVDAFVLERRFDTDHVGQLGWLDRVVSAEPVLTPEIRRLADAVASRYAGTRADVLRLAIRPRHARAEATQPQPTQPLQFEDVDSAAWARYARGDQFLTALGEAVPPAPVAGAARRELVCPDRRGRRGHCGGRPRGAGDRSGSAGHRGALGSRRHPCRRSVVAALSAGLGPSARYRRWLAVLRARPAW